ncbi:alpha/beta fold hydrolase [Actinotalea sp. M2MS4P-6]|uniref:alpha/beta fold hydrolase n=1 Tax=Actinotalea sp. M2MS4P-6 TaxID=2983762 RepID=UPI0021E37021|nr:alpha/beta fold hydrolase [Actinotalea sp. M2MS4P-6]MCV2392965.1 alpha/beta fold hydrolase [Actinotalea sp. M2MS4P-6]
MAGGTRVAFAVSGSGPPLLVAPGWLSNLELDWSIPAQRLFYESLSSGRSLVRYDRPGCGLSDPYDGPRSVQHELDTLAAVVAALQVERFDLFGWSLGAPVAAAWAAAHPESVSRLVLYGGWASGAAIGDDASREHVLGLLATHWGLGSDVLTELFAPDADPGTRRVLAEYQRASSSAETAVALLGLAYRLDVSESVPHVQAPTLVLHRDRDRAAPPEQGRLLAAQIPGARHVELTGRSHLPSMGDSRAVVDQVRRFLRLRPLRAAAPIGLTARQAEVASLVAQGLTNREIAERLQISERSAESHLERIRDRLGLRSRAQLAAWYTAQHSP